MSLRINNNSPSWMAAHNLQSVIKDMNSVQERMTTGRKINRASDGPASLVIGKRFEAQLAGIEQAQKNVANSINLIDSADKSLETTEKLLMSARQLALSSMDGTKSAAERTANNQELTEILASIDRIGNNTRFGDTQLLDGSFTAQTFQVGQTAGETVTVSIGDMRTDALDIDEVDVDTVANATTALAAIDTALNNVTAERGRLGGISKNTFSAIQSNLKVQAENIESARSTIMDTDYEKDSAVMAQLQVRMQVASAMLASTSQQSGLVLNLLG